MSDVRFILCQDDFGNYEIRYDDKIVYFLWEVAPILNEQQSIIIKQDEEIKKLKRTERSWRRIHCCNKESDNCGIVIEQEDTIKQLEGENDNMNLFIKQTIEPLLFNCVFELDTIESMSQVELSRKIEDEIIPFIQDFKYLKYESPEEEKQDKSE